MILHGINYVELKFTLMCVGLLFTKRPRTAIDNHNSTYSNAVSANPCGRLLFNMHQEQLQADCNKIKLHPGTLFCVNHCSGIWFTLYMAGHS